MTAAYAALNRNDIPGFLAVFDPQVGPFEPPGWPEGERFLGIAAAFISEPAAMAFAGVG